MRVVPATRLIIATQSTSNRAVVPSAARTLWMAVRAARMQAAVKFARNLVCIAFEVGLGVELGVELEVGLGVVIVGPPWAKVSVAVAGVTVGM